MVVIHYKKSELNQFRWETTTKLSVDELVKQLCYINNLRIKIDKLASAIEGLADHGPLKPEALRGLTMPETIEPAMYRETLPAEQKKWARVEPNMNQRSNPDKTGYRIGVAPMIEVAEKMKQVASDAKNYISKNKVKDRKNLDIKELEEQVSLLRGATMIAYPAHHGLPEWDPAFLILEDKCPINVMWPDVEWLEEQDTVAWFSGRELYKNKCLGEQILGGYNEKNTLIIKLDKKGNGAPVRESPIDEMTQKEMMAFYYKKQEEQKKLEAESDEAYANSSWANPDALKKNLVTGGKNVEFKFR